MNIILLFLVLVTGFSVLIILGQINYRLSKIEKQIEEKLKGW